MAFVPPSLMAGWAESSEYREPAIPTDTPYYLMSAAQKTQVLIRESLEIEKELKE